MKLLFCKACGDVQKLQFETRTCRCRESSGYYLPDGDNCTIAGDNAVVIAIGNGSLTQAVQRQPETGQGAEIKAWVFAKDYHKIKIMVRDYSGLPMKEAMERYLADHCQ